MSTLERRLAAIEDREAIADLIHRHAEHIRSGTLHAAHDLFHPDATYDVSHFEGQDLVIVERIEGLDAILGSMDEIAGEGVRLCPMIHNIRVSVDGDIAKSTCVSMTTIWPMGNNFIGEYRDSYRREGGTWRFSARAFIGFGALDGTSPELAHARYQAAKVERAAG